MTPLYSVVIPCHNSGEGIDTWVNRTAAAMRHVAGGFELIMVNDASPQPQTWEAIRRNACSHEFVRGLDLQFNVGQFCALIAGMEASRGAYVITMDDDLQTPPEELPRLIEAMQAHPEMDAILAAYAVKQHPWYRKIGSKLVGLMFRWLYAKPKNLQSSSFRIMKRCVVQAICAHRTARPVMGALVQQVTKRTMNVWVEHHARIDGKSGYRLSRLAGAAFDNVICSSTAPLRAISVLGICVAGGSICFGVITFVEWFRGLITEPGFTTITLLITFFGGITLVAIGVLGEYVARIVAEVTRSPRYVVRETIHNGEIRRAQIA